MRIFKITILMVVGVLAVLQIFPKGRTHSNPPITGEPQWDSPATEDFARRACYNCHSNETQWPWYAYVAPVSWRVGEHVEEGRQHLNFSTFDQPQRHAHDAAEQVEEGEMPPWDYLLMHPEARLTKEEKAAFVAGLKATFGTESPNQGRRRVDEDH